LKTTKIMLIPNYTTVIKDSLKLIILDLRIRPRRLHIRNKIRKTRIKNDNLLHKTIIEIRWLILIWTSLKLIKVFILQC